MKPCFLDTFRTSMQVRTTGCAIRDRLLSLSMGMPSPPPFPMISRGFWAFKNLESSYKGCDERKAAHRSHVSSFRYIFSAAKYANRNPKQKLRKITLLGAVLKFMIRIEDRNFHPIWKEYALLARHITGFVCAPVLGGDRHRRCGAATASTAQNWSPCRVELLYDPGRKGGWQGARLHQMICEGSGIKVGANSRASIRLASGVVIRLHAGSVLSLDAISPEKATLLNLLNGFVHFISRTPRQLKISTPIANAGPEGTEFAISVDHGKAALWVYEGGVKFYNGKGSVKLAPGARRTSQLRPSPPSQGRHQAPRCRHLGAVLPARAGLPQGHRPYRQ